MPCIGHNVERNACVWCARFVLSLSVYRSPAYATSVLRAMSGCLGFISLGVSRCREQGLDFLSVQRRYCG